MIPGSNILSQALQIIASQQVIYKKNNGRTVNQIGQYVSSYDGDQLITGSFQPVPRSLYHQYGLDFNKDYFTFYTDTNVKDILRDSSGDMIQFNGEIFQVESANDWFAIDSWVGVLCVRINQ